MATVERKGRATSIPSERERVLREVNEQSVKFIHLWFTDIEGHLKSFSITPAELEGALDDGMGFDGSSITGFNAIEESDMVAFPDPTTFQLMPNGDVRVARMICDVVTPDGQPYDGDPRNVLRRALERMHSMGFDTFNVGPELEYFLFEDDKGTEPLDEGGYFAMTTMDAASDLRHDTVKALESMGIPIEYVHHEVGPSQHEIDMRYASALDMADHTVTYRLVVKEIAKKAGYHATFMPKPLFGENGSGMHTHQSLFAEGKNAFFDADDEWHLSGVGKAFIRPAPPRSRDLGGLRAVGQLLQAARPRVRGARLRGVVPAQPLGADPDPALQAGQRAGDTCGDPLPGSGLQPLPHVRRPSARGARGHRAGLRAAGAHGAEPLQALSRGPEGARHRRAAGDPRGGDRRARGLGARAKGARRSRLRRLREAEAAGVGRLPRPAHTVGDGELPGRLVSAPLGPYDPLRCRRFLSEAGGLTDGRLRATPPRAARGR